MKSLLLIASWLCFTLTGFGQLSINSNTESIKIDYQKKSKAQEKTGIVLLGGGLVLALGGTNWIISQKGLSYCITPR